MPLPDPLPLSPPDPDLSSPELPCPEFPGAGAEFRPALRLPDRDGSPYWAATVPANGTAVLRYRVRAPRDGDSDD